MAGSTAAPGPAAAASGPKICTGWAAWAAVPKAWTLAICSKACLAAGAGGAGDGIVTIEIDAHRFFRRDGDDVRVDLPITLDEAVHGAKVKVPTVDGAVMMTVQPGTSSGAVLRLKGKGFTRKTGGRGDQLVTLEIALPRDVAELARRLDGWRDESDPRARFVA